MSSFSFGIWPGSESRQAISIINSVWEFDAKLSEFNEFDMSGGLLKSSKCVSLISFLLPCELEQGQLT